MRVALVQVPTYGTNMAPLGLAYVASYLKSKKNIVKIFDFNIELYFDSDKKRKFYWHHGYLENDMMWLNETLLKEIFPDTDNIADKWTKNILKFNPDVVGFSTCFTQEMLGLKIAKSLKKEKPNMKIIFGGPSFFDKNKVIEFNNYDCVDSIIVGEGELAFSDIVERHRKNQSIEKVVRSDIIKDLDLLPFPDWSLFNLGKYDEKNVVVMGTSRGCTHKCTFCIEHENFVAYRQRSAENIFLEIKNNSEKYGIVDIAFNDSLINGNIRVLEKWVDLIIENKIEMLWNGNARISHKMTFELLKKMKKAGCQHLIYGIESASQKVLNKMNKGFNIKDAEVVLKNTKRAGIIPITNWIIGFPNENMFDFFKSLSFVYRLRRYMKVGPPWGNPYVFLPNSQVNENRKRYGVIGNEPNWYSNKFENNPVSRAFRVWLFRKLVRKLKLDAFA